MKQKEINPFLASKYPGPAQFCDRESETEYLLNASRNNRPVVLYSPRRMGKTGLIKHVHHHLRASHVCVYIDILNTTSDVEFQIKFVESIVNALNSRKLGTIEGFLKIFNKYRPKIGLNTTTGDPWIELGVSDDATLSGQTMTTLMSFLMEQNLQMHIAIDEFQQIASYKTTTTDATIREWIQSELPISWVLSGSKRHLLLDLVSNPKKPLYRSLDQMPLDKINYASYAKFIATQFENASRQITQDQIHDILTWTDRYTYYTQVFCNRLFGNYQGDIKDYQIADIKQRLLLEQEQIILTLRQIMTSNQYKVWKGIAQEGELNSVRTLEFSQKYKVAPSSAQLALEYLIHAELVLDIPSLEGNSYKVYDVFFAHYLKEIA